MAEIGKDISHAVTLLQQGNLVAIPTETVYGLAANALDPVAVSKIFEAKKRPFFDPLIVHIASISEVEKYASVFPESAKKLCSMHWPGPLTIVLPKRDIIPELVTSGQPTVGLRVPRHALTLELLRKTNFPLAAPSANPFGYVSPTNADHVQSHLGQEVPYILDGGPCEVGLESTIISFAGSKPKILRLGGMELAEIEQIIGPCEVTVNQNSNPAAPGQLDAHYSPHCRFEIREPLPEEFEDKKAALLRFSTPIKGFDSQRQYILSPTANMHEAAAKLFQLIRELDSAGYELILAEFVPEVGLGMAINDRLRRAAAKFNSQ